MKKIINQYKEVILYLIFGVLTTVVNILTYYIATKWCLIDYQVSNVISWVVSVTFAFVTNKIYVFESKGKDKKQLLKETIRFYAFRLLSLGIDMTAMYVMVDMICINDLLAKIIANVIVVILNYVFSKLFIFKKDEQ